MQQTNPNPSEHNPLKWYAIIDTFWKKIFMTPSSSTSQDTEDGLHPAQGVNNAQNEMMRLVELGLEELNKLCNVPQLGLFRNYQEQFLGLIEHYNDFFVTSLNYLRLMSSPVEQTQTKVTAGTFPSSRDSYQTWIKELEHAYQILLSSPEYIKTTHELLHKYEMLFSAWQKAISSGMAGMGQVSSRDFDALAQETYQLKRELRLLKQEIRNHNQKRSARTLPSPHRRPKDSTQEIAMEDVA